MRPVLMLLNVTLGGNSPPYGYAMYAFKGAEDVPMSEMYGAAYQPVSVRHRAVSGERKMV